MANEVIIGVIIFIGAAIIYYFWQRGQFHPERSLPLPEEQVVTLPWYAPFFSPAAKARLSRQIRQRKHKQQHDYWEEFLAGYGLLPRKVLLPREVQKLRALIQEHRKQKLLTPPQRSALAQLEELVEGKKEKKKFTPREAKNIFALLKRISRR